jgi:hypothetical protein
MISNNDDPLGEALSTKIYHPPCEKYVRKTIGEGLSESPEVLSELYKSVKNSLKKYQKVLGKLEILDRYDKDVWEVCQRVYHYY